MKTYKKLTVGGLLLAGIALTGCAQEVPQHDGTHDPGPTVIQTQKSADEKQSDETKDAGDNQREPIDKDANTKAEVEEAVKTPYNEQPFGYDPAVLVDNATDEAKAVFGDLDMEEGVRTALVNFRAIQTIENFSQARDTSKDAVIIRNQSDIMTKNLIDDLVKEAESDKGLTTLIVADSEGRINDPEGNLYEITSGAPNVIVENLLVDVSDVQANGQQDLIITGDVAFLWTVEGNKGVMLKAECTTAERSSGADCGFRVNVAPSADDEWLTSGLFIGLDEFSIVDISELEGSDA